MQIDRFSIETSGPSGLGTFVPRAPKAEAQRNQAFTRHFLLRMVVVFRVDRWCLGGCDGRFHRLGLQIQARWERALPLETLQRPAIQNP